MVVGKHGEYGGVGEGMLQGAGEEALLLQVGAAVKLRVRSQIDAANRTVEKSPTVASKSKPRASTFARLPESCIAIR